MTWFFAILLVLALGGIALVASGWGTPLARVYDDRPDVGVPAEGELTGDDLRRLRFGLVLRGYRMSEVDELLARLASQLEASQLDEAGERERRANGGERGEDDWP
jgi:DivIVA domain-containing protein